MYSPSVGRFLQRDPAGYLAIAPPEKIAEPDYTGSGVFGIEQSIPVEVPEERYGTNLYEFVGGNPVVTIDPSGLQGERIDLDKIRTPENSSFIDFLKKNGYDTVDISKGGFVQTKTGCPLFCRKGEIRITISVSANCAKNDKAGMRARQLQRALNHAFSLFPCCSSLPAGATTLPALDPINIKPTFYPMPIDDGEFAISTWKHQHCEFFMTIEARNSQPAIVVIPPGGFVSPLSW